jgi:type IV secretory pathway TrbL component
MATCPSINGSVMLEQATARPAVSRPKICSVALVAEPPSLIAIETSVPEATDEGEALIDGRAGLVGRGMGVLTGGAAGGMTVGVVGAAVGGAGS